MKHFVLAAIATMLAVVAWAQSANELRPNWAYIAPVPPAGANYFLSWGVGEGRDELGVVGITGEDIDRVAAHGINSVVKFNRMKRRVVSATEPIALADGRMKVYILIQVQRNVNGADDFYSLDTGSFRDRGFERQLADYNAAIIGGIVATESLRQSYKSKASSAFDTDQKRRYNSRATNCANVRNGFIVGAAAIYVWNVIDGIAARGKKQPLMVGDARLRISPYAAPQESGVLLSLNF